jgi:hypothetical protein
MPDTLEPAGGGRYPSAMESRVAVLEQIARTTAAGLERLERRFGFTAMLGGFGALLGVMAHGFHWL